MPVGWLLQEHGAALIRINDLAHLLFVLSLASMIIPSPPLPWACPVALAVLPIVSVATGPCVVRWSWTPPVVIERVRGGRNGVLSSARGNGLVVLTEARLLGRQRPLALRDVVVIVIDATARPLCTLAFAAGSRT